MPKTYPLILSFPIHPEDIRLRVALQFLKLNTIEIRSPYKYLRHQHHEYEVIIVDRGRYECRLNGVLLRLAPGNLLIVKPGDWHEDTCRPSLRYFSFCFRLPHAKNNGESIALFQETIAPSRQIVWVNRNAMWPILAAIRQEANRTDLPSHHIQHALLMELFWRMLRALPDDRLSSDFRQCASSQHFISRISTLFQCHLYKKYSIQEMARSMGMSQSSFCHKCKHILGLPPAKAFLKAKIDYAIQYLAYPAMSIKEISALLNFENPYHFSKVFKHYKGHPPSYYR